MKRTLALLAASTILGACGDGTNPQTGGIPIGGGGATGGSCSQSSGITCWGEVNSFRYVSNTDVVTINNLPFDLDGTYVRVATLDRAGFQGYRNAAGSED
jgi:hypothetical protein